MPLTEGKTVDMGTSDLISHTHLTQVIQDAVLKLCTRNILFSKSLEVDGLICISRGDKHPDIVVKMHRTIVKPPDTPDVFWDVPEQQAAVQSSHSVSSLTTNQDVSRLSLITEESDNVVPCEKTSQNTAGFHVHVKDEPVNYPLCAFRKRENDNSELVTPEKGKRIKSEHPVSKSDNGTDSLSDKSSWTPNTKSHDELMYQTTNQRTPNHNPIPDKDLVCNICYKTFANAGNLRRHVKSAHLNQYFKCSKCQKSFNYSSNLKRHRIKCIGVNSTTDIKVKKQMSTCSSQDHEKNTQDINTRYNDNNTYYDDNDTRYDDNSSQCDENNTKSDDNKLHCESTHFDDNMQYGANQLSNYEDFLTTSEDAIHNTGK